MGSFIEWFKSKDPDLQKVIMDFPLGTVISMKGKSFWVVGYTDDKELSVSPINPHKDWSSSLSLSFRIPAERIKDNFVRRDTVFPETN